HCGSFGLNPTQNERQRRCIKQLTKRNTTHAHLLTQPVLRCSTRCRCALCAGKACTCSTRVGVPRVCHANPHVLEAMTRQQATLNVHLNWRAHAFSGFSAAVTRAGRPVSTSTAAVSISKHDF